MAHVIASLLGWGILLAAAGVLVVALGRRAATHSILAPVVVGVALRLAVMLIAHVGSLSLGDRGIFFLDDQTYLRGGALLAGEWREGHTPNPTRYDVLGTYQIGYQLFVGLIFTLGTSGILLGKLANVLLGGVTVYAVARIAGQTLGERVQRRAAWLAAFAPSLTWWSAPLMKEALVTMLLAVGVLAVTRLPRRTAVAILGAAVATLILVRVSAAVALVIGAGVAIALAGRQAEQRWLSSPLIVFFGTLLAGVAATVVLVSQGDVGSFVSQYQVTIERMVERYQGGNLLRTPYDMAKSLVTPLPWVFDSGTRNWDRALYPGVWVLLCAYPLAVVGAWRLRQRPEVWMLVAVALVALLANAITGGFPFRQRSMIEPLILLLALAGISSWRTAGRLAASSLAVVSVVATLQARSLVVGVAVGVAAAGVLLATRRLPSASQVMPPESPMALNFRKRLEPVPAGAPPAVTWFSETRNLVAAVRASTRAWRQSMVRGAPPLEHPVVAAASDDARTSWRRAVGVLSRAAYPPLGEYEGVPTKRREDHALAPQTWSTLQGLAPRADAGPATEARPAPSLGEVWRTLGGLRLRLQQGVQSVGPSVARLLRDAAMSVTAAREGVISVAPALYRPAPPEREHQHRAVVAWSTLQGLAPRADAGPATEARPAPSLGEVWRTLVGLRLRLQQGVQSVGPSVARLLRDAAMSVTAAREGVISVAPAPYAPAPPAVAGRGPAVADLVLRRLRSLGDALQPEPAFRAVPSIWQRTTGSLRPYTYRSPDEYGAVPTERPRRQAVATPRWSTLKQLAPTTALRPATEPAELGSSGNAVRILRELAPPVQLPSTPSGEEKSHTERARD